MHDIRVSPNKVPHLLSTYWLTSNVSVSCLDMMAHENKENHKCEGKQPHLFINLTNIWEKTYSNKWNLVSN